MLARYRLAHTGRAPLAHRREGLRLADTRSPLPTLLAAAA